MTPIYHCRSR